jgi:hypothetical protein
MRVATVQPRNNTGYCSRRVCRDLISITLQPYAMVLESLIALNGKAKVFIRHATH